MFSAKPFHLCTSPPLLHRHKPSYFPFTFGPRFGIYHSHMPHSPAPFMPLYFALTGPTGTGKTTLMKHLLAADKNLQNVVSFTTREKRHGEVNGETYHYLTHAQFHAAHEKGDILEHSFHFDNYYGTPRAAINALAAQKSDGLNDIQYDGVFQLRKTMPEQFVSILIMPPSEAAMQERLLKRAGKSIDEQAALKKRLTTYEKDWGHFNDPNHVFHGDELRGSSLGDYAHKVINDDLDDTLKILHAIIEQERKKRRG